MMQTTVKPFWVGCVSVFLVTLSNCRRENSDDTSSKTPTQHSSARPTELNDTPSDDGTGSLSSQQDEVGEPVEPRPSREQDPRGKGWSFPDWALDARWYYVDITKFRNGDPRNDPPESTPVAERSVAHAPNHYGGDVQGLAERLPYLKELGINALCVTGIFGGHVGREHPCGDLLHVDDSVGIRGSHGKLVRETDDPSSWQLSNSDGEFLRFIEKAHQEGFYIVVEGRVRWFPPPNGADGTEWKCILASLSRWLDPNCDGNPADGIDGWLIRLDPEIKYDSKPVDPSLWTTLRAVKSVNPRALLMGMDDDEGFDVVLSTRAVNLVSSASDTRFPDHDRISVQLIEASPARFDDPEFLPRIVRRDLGFPARLCDDPRRPALGSNETKFENEGVSDSMPKDVRSVETIKLAIVLQHFFKAAPVTIFGDEVGMTGPDAMWWMDTPDAKARHPGFRGDFFALIQWLHILREKYAPLRRGDFRVAFHDDQRRLLAVSRTLHGEEIILVVNYGGEKQLLHLPAGKPGQLAGVMNPTLHPERLASQRKRSAAPRDPANIEALPVTGNRQFVSEAGTLRLWVGAMSARVVLLNGKPPSR